MVIDPTGINYLISRGKSTGVKAKKSVNIDAWKPTVVKKRLRMVQKL
jgi:hypothetical protein